MIRLETWRQGPTFWEYLKDKTFFVDDLDDPALYKYLKENVGCDTYVVVRFKFWDVSNV